MNLRYLFGAILSLPLLPIMYFQGRKIKAAIPNLSEATENEGVANISDTTTDKIRMITIGESTIAGVGVETHEEGFTGTLARELSTLLKAEVSWKVYARSGYNAKKVANILVPKIFEQELDLIVIGLGGNDAFELNRPSKWRRDITALIMALRSKYPATPMVFCNMPPIKLFPAFTPLIKFTIGNLVEILGEELQHTVSQHENTYYFGEKITFERWIERYEVDGEPQDFFSDGVHPSKLTYQVWAKDVATNIVNSPKLKFPG